MIDEVNEPHMPFRFPGETRNMAEERVAMELLKQTIIDLDEAKSLTKIGETMVKIRNLAIKIRNGQ